MKIRTKEKSYEEVMALPREKHENPMRQSGIMRKLLKAISYFDLKAVHFSYEKTGMEQLGDQEPCLVLMNHSSFIDLKIAATLLADREYHIVCTLDGLVGKKSLMRLLGCIPAKKFINDITLIKDMRYAIQKLHASVLMYPEASYSFDGTQTPLPHSLGKCIKLLKAPVVMIRTNGAFLRDPLYNGLQLRRTRVSAKMDYLLSPFVAFGKAESRELAELQVRTIEALKETGIKAVVQAFQIPEKKNTEKLHFVDKIPYSYIFPRVKAVVHHGGCTTNGIGIWAGCPTLIIPLALDQWYYGRTVHELGLGPEPLYIRKKLCTKDQLKEALLDLASGKYEKRAAELSGQIRQENGIEEAIHAIEDYVHG